MSGHACPFLAWRSGSDGARTWSSPQWAGFTGQDGAASAERGWLDAVHPDDRAAVQAAWLAASGTGLLSVDHRLRAVSGGHRWFRSVAGPGAGAGGDATWFGGSTGIDDLRTMLDHQQGALAALQHRASSTLGTLRSMARMTLRPEESAAEYAAALDGRFAAMARVQASIIRNPLAGTDLAQLVAGEFTTLALHEGDRLSINGPPVRLLNRAAESLGLALHEMATNSLRHGALTTEKGRIEVSWEVAEDAGRLVFRWREPGSVIPPTGIGEGGFGSEVIELFLPYQLHAVTGLRFEPDGLHVVIELPLAGNILIAPA